MSSDKERLIFRKELTRLYSDYNRCEDCNVKKEIIEDINILTKALELLSE